MDVNPTRPAEGAGEARAEKRSAERERFEARAPEAKPAQEEESDANTRLSRGPDEIELSDRGRELARRFEEGPERR